MDSHGKKEREMQDKTEISNNIEAENEEDFDQPLEKELMTTLSLPQDMKDIDLENLKLIPRETYYAVIARLIKFYNENNGPTSNNGNKTTSNSQ